MSVPEPITQNPNASINGRYHFLDVGGIKYGECSLVEFGDIRILIDGAHVNDFSGQRGYRSIPEQLSAILAGRPPFDITLLVVTHCHADHVGCLLELVEENVIRPRFALLTDPKLGFGRKAGYDIRSRDSSDPGVALAAALREEDSSDLGDADLRAFIADAATVEQRYAELVERLAQTGVGVVLYQGQPLPDEMMRAVAATGLTLIGPSLDQLLLCAEQIETTNKEAEDTLSDALYAGQDLVAIYRALVGSGPAADARNPRGSGMNCQSITLAFGPPSARALMAGDMQFHEPGVTGADAEIEKLKAAVIAAGPFALFKTTHHTSHNGQDKDFLDAIGSPTLIVHSGGIRDADHPFPSVLRMLKGREGIRFARTDRNGCITVEPHEAMSDAISVERGSLNDFEPNGQRDEREPPLPSQQPAAPTRQSSVAVSPSSSPTFFAPLAAQIIIVNLPHAPVDLTVAGIDIQMRLPPIVQAPPPSPQAERLDSRNLAHAPPQRLGGPGYTLSRSLQDLLFVTDPTRLRANIGRAEADQALGAVRAAQGVLLQGRGDTLLGATSKALQANPDIKGVVILGGYDVVPSVSTDVLGADLRARLGEGNHGDSVDQFWVWSDRQYGDQDGDGLGEIPVSRIPDARDAQLFLAALNAKPFRAAERFGVRNVLRPFAESAWPPSLGARALEVSETFLDSDVSIEALTASCHYFMLHGADRDGREFSGQRRAGGSYPRAFTVRNVPERFDGIVFSGCCWSALTVDGKARDTVSPAPRAREASIALSYLRAGALAFVGCTGSHYSGPDVDRDTNYAARLHEAFFRQLAVNGAAPAKALFEAKREHLTWTLANQNRMEPLDLARRLKNTIQFTCLGLGW